MRIYIPTRGRPRQRTVEALPNAIHKKYRTTLVCPPGEVAALSGRYGNAVDVVACKKEGIAATRQFILDHARKHAHVDDQRVLMLDDDLPAWSVRLPDADKYRRAEPKELMGHFSAFDALLKTHAHGSIGHRLFANAKPAMYYNSRMLRALAYNLRLMPKGVGFRLPVMEDFDIALQLLTKGQDSFTYNALVQDQYGTNTSGGCSLYRTAQLQADAARLLAHHWPDYVTVVEKAKPKSGWEGVGDRLDVRVNWNKAAKAGGCKHAR